VIALGHLRPDLSGFGIVTAVTLGASAGMYFAIAYPPAPDRMRVTPAGLVFHRPNGRELTLKLAPKTKVTLYDQSALMARPHLIALHSPYVLGHSATTEQIVLTREAWEAIRTQLTARGATLVRAGPVLFAKGSVASAYLL
jgi:hypothetical protein